MKKFLSAALACLTASALFVGCGNDSSSSSKDEKVGMITNLNMTEQNINAKLHSINAGDYNYSFVYYDNLNAMIMGLDSKSVDEISVYKSVADYLVVRNPNMEIDNSDKLQLEMKDKFCCAVKSEEAALLDAINDAIDAMKGDGTLQELTKKYITDLKGDEEPQAVEMPTIEGAETLKVAVTGDLPPLDLIRADGTPAGFNTATLAEIGKRINKNIELVNVDSAARASALASDKVDMIFWVRVPDHSAQLPANFDRPDGIDVSDYYFIDEIVHVDKK